jgi:hypothetical protein
MGRNLIGGFAILLVLGCSARGPETTPAAPAPRTSTPRAEPASKPVQNQVDTTRRQELVARAEQALAQSLPLDFGRPFSDSSAERPATGALFLEACRAGDNPSCWIARDLGGVDTPYHANAIIRANCVAGDLMSCRSLKRDEGLSPDTPGWAGRIGICAQGSPSADPEQKRCGIADLRRECLAGFPFSCWWLIAATEEQVPDRELVTARLARLAREGCQARIEAECDLILMREPTAADRLQVAERLCPLVVSSCAVLAKHYLARGELIRARDLAEQSCQYGHDTQRCRLLGTDYANGVFPEPVTGRGEALLTWACRSDIAKERDDVCKARATKQSGRASKSR